MYHLFSLIILALIMPYGIIVNCFAMPDTSNLGKKMNKEYTRKIVSADHALERLMHGNKRFVKQDMKHSKEDAKTREKLKREGQNPIAVIVSCSDSRVPPEVIFDHYLGMLFVIRNAGPVINDDTIGSIWYAISNLNVKLVMILGHEKCGAVHATVCGKEATDRYLGALIGKIDLAKVEVDSKRKYSKKEGAFREYDVTVQHVKNFAEFLSSVSEIQNKINNDGVKVVSAYYRMKTGEVELL